MTVNGGAIRTPAKALAIPSDAAFTFTAGAIDLTAPTVVPAGAGQVSRLHPGRVRHPLDRGHVVAPVAHRPGGPFTAPIDVDGIVSAVDVHVPVLAAPDRLAVAEIAADEADGVGGAGDPAAGESGATV